jgi:hypothetical protein
LSRSADSDFVAFVLVTIVVVVSIAFVERASVWCTATAVFTGVLFFSTAGRHGLVVVSMWCVITIANTASRVLLYLLRLHFAFFIVSLSCQVKSECKNFLDRFGATRAYGDSNQPTGQPALYEGVALSTMSEWPRELLSVNSTQTETKPEMDL